MVWIKQQGNNTLVTRKVYIPGYAVERPDEKSRCPALVNLRFQSGSIEGEIWASMDLPNSILTLVNHSFAGSYHKQG